jgi:hypothetical protein
MEEDKTKSQLPALIGVLGLLASILLVIFFIVPKTSEIKTLANEVAAKEQELELGKQKVAAIREAVKLIASAKKEVETLNVSIPKSPSADEALAQMQDIASQSEIKVVEATVGGASDGYQEITITMSGSYSNMVSFLDKMQNNLRPIEVKTINLFYNEETEEISMSLNLMFPYFDLSQLEQEASANSELSEEVTSEQ